jgi:hypothetical protein
MSEFVYVQLVQTNDGIWFFKQEGEEWVPHRKFSKIINIDPEEIEAQQVS